MRQGIMLRVARGLRTQTRAARRVREDVVGAGRLLLPQRTAPCPVARAAS